MASIDSLFFWLKSYEIIDNEIDDITKLKDILQINKTILKIFNILEISEENIEEILKNLIENYTNDLFINILNNFFNLLELKNLNIHQIELYFHLIFYCYIKNDKLIDFKINLNEIFILELTKLKEKILFSSNLFNFLLIIYSKQILNIFSNYNDNELQKNYNEKKKNYSNLKLESQKIKTEYLQLKSKNIEIEKNLIKNIEENIEIENNNQKILIEELNNKEINFNKYNLLKNEFEELKKEFKEKEEIFNLKNKYNENLKEINNLEIKLNELKKIKENKQNFLKEINNKIPLLINNLN